MHFNSIIQISLSVAALCGIGSATPSVGERGSLEKRQRCSTPGWIPACPGFFACVPPGAICCDDNISYAIPPGTCPRGTNPIATASTSAVVPTITAAPTSTQTLVNYNWYTLRITWYYYYYYYTYYAVQRTYTLVSTELTSYTTFSFTATDAAQASQLSSSFKATLSFSTPVQTATPTSGYIAPSTSSTSTAPTPTPTTTSTSTRTRTPTGTGGSTGTVTVTPTFSPPPFTGSGNTLVSYMSHHASGSMLWVLGCVGVAPALLMMWL